MSHFRHLEQEPFAEIVLRWGNPPYLVRHREGPLPPWGHSLISHLMETLAEKPIFDRDHVGNAMVVMGSVLGFPCVEVRLASNRPQWPSVPCVVVSGKEFDPFISIEAKGKLFPTNFETEKLAPYTVELGGETCYVCERSGNALVVRAIDFDLNS
ncbi:MAG: hypothetical protein NUV56_02695 [Candidatus Uhrbacteria bacterium]|nr:hypothetical protein [Candidatus Uhrbacteria bacterium]